MKTRDQLITDALEKAGGLGVNETASANQISRASSALYSLLKTFNTKGMPLWKLKQHQIPMGVFINGYTSMGAMADGAGFETLTKPLKIISAQRYDTIAETTIDLYVDTRYEYFVIPAVNVESVPTQIYARPTKTLLELRLWPRPDAYWTDHGMVYIDVQEAITTLTAGTDLPDFPDEWEEAIIYNLADRLAPNYGLPVQERQMLKKEAEARLEEALSFGNEEGSVFIRPAQRM
jgi:hypothetical protein